MNNWAGSLLWNDNKKRPKCALIVTKYKDYQRIDKNLI